MKIVVTHSSPDMDAITSVWLIKKFLPGWENAVVKFVPAGDRIGRLSIIGSRLSDTSQSVSQLTGNLKTDKPESEDRQQKTHNRNPIEMIDGDEVIHVDTGLGVLDHHQTPDDTVCGASLTFDYVKEHIAQNKIGSIERMVKVVVDIDHFKEAFRKDPLSDYHEFELSGILDGLKLEFPGQDELYVVEVSKCLDAVLHEFENRIWAEKEVKENSIKFETRFGKGMGFETINDSVVKLAQKMGYAIVARKDPRKGYVRIKVRPDSKIDLTLACEKLKKIDPDATWYLHISKKMLLNGSVKNPKMKPTKLAINEIIAVLEKI